MENNSTNLPRFTWDEQRSRAAVSLANGATKQEVADEISVDRTTIYNWLHHPDFAAEVDRLSIMVGIASRAQRLRLAMRAVKAKLKDGVPQSDKDVLEWLKFAQSETDGVKLDLGKLAASVAQAETPVADSGQVAGATGTTAEDARLPS
jgi:IS30 family transposase